MKINWETALTVLLVLVVFKVIDNLFLDKMINKVLPSASNYDYEESNYDDSNSI